MSPCYRRTGPRYFLYHAPSAPCSQIPGALCAEICRARATPTASAVEPVRCAKAVYTSRRSPFSAPTNTPTSSPPRALRDKTAILLAHLTARLRAIKRREPLGHALTHRVQISRACRHRRPAAQQGGQHYKTKKNTTQVRGHSQDEGCAGAGVRKVRDC